MVFVEYNTSKRYSVEDVIDNIRISDTSEDYELLPFVPFFDIHPSENIFPMQNVSNVNTKENYLLRFTPIKTYGYGKYCIEYENKFYLFEYNIRKGTNLYFYFFEYIDEQDETHFEPNILVKGYWQAKEVLPVYDVLELNKSGSDITFSNIKADFGIRSMSQLPMALQEIRIWKGELLDGEDLSESELLYTGFLDKASLTQKYKNEDECDIELTLLSPKNITTKRYVSINGTYTTDEAFNLIFQPLINDGFQIKTIDVEKKNISVNYFLENIETIMNDLSNKLNLFWTIDNKKNIYITDIIKLLGKNPKLTINENDNIEGLYELRPVIENNNYFNCINVKNARIYTSANDEEVLEIMKLVKDQSMEFVNPIDFNITGCKRVCYNNNAYRCSILTIYNEEGDILYDVSYEEGDDKIQLPEGMVWSDGDTENATIILKRDNFFKNLVTGIEWKGRTTEIDHIKTDTMLKYQVFKFTNSNEVNKCSQLITDSGLIETTIDVNESWFTFNELVEYCSNKMTANSNNVASVEISIDKNYDLDIGDIIRIDKQDFFINGDFVITEISEQISGYDSYDCHIVAQNNKLQENYIDIFRKEIQEENEVKYQNTNIIEFISEEVIESYGVYTDNEGGI